MLLLYGPGILFYLLPCCVNAVMLRSLRFLLIIAPRSILCLPLFFASFIPWYASSCFLRWSFVSHSMPKISPFYSISFCFIPSSSLLSFLLLVRCFHPNRVWGKHPVIQQVPANKKPPCIRNRSHFLHKGLLLYETILGLKLKR